MSKETKSDSTKQAVFDMLAVYAGVENGIAKATFFATVNLATGLKASTIEQYLKELRGQIHIKKGHILVDDGAFFLSTTSTCTQTVEHPRRQKRTRVRKGSLPGWNHFKIR